MKLQKGDMMGENIVVIVQAIVKHLPKASDVIRSE